MLIESFGPYTIKSLLGKGAMGIVYLACDEQGNEVALKLIKKEVLEKVERVDEMKKRFIRESRYAEQLVHRHIVQTFDSGEINGTLYLVCEVIRGQTLESLLKQYNTLSEKHTITLMVQVLSALQELHQRKLVHRDIKPANILIDNHGVIKLADFGLLRSVSCDRTALTKTGMLLGTPFYMAPEQIVADKQLDIRCDLYAVGVILYQCVCGKTPFTGTIAKVFNDHLATPVPEISVPISQKLKDIIFNLLAKNREDRIHTPREVSKKLQQALKDYNDKEEATVMLEYSQKLFNISHDENLEETSISKQFVFEEKNDKNTLHQVCISKQGTKDKLFVYTGSSLVIGRNAIQEGKAMVCLRHRPVFGNEDLIRRISGKHLHLTVRMGDTFLTDTSSSGTVMDGVQINKKQQKFTGCHKVIIGKVMEILVSKHHLSGYAHYMNNLNIVCEPNILIERVVNGKEHAYILIPGAIDLEVKPDGTIRPSSSGHLTLLFFNNCLWLYVPSLSEKSCWPITDNMNIQIGEHLINFCKLDPQDQKK